MAEDLEFGRVRPSGLVPSPSAAALIAQPSMQALLERSVAAYKAMDPVERALHDADQRRSFVRGQCGHDPGPDVLAQEVRRLRSLLAATEPKGES